MRALVRLGWVELVTHDFVSAVAFVGAATGDGRDKILATIWWPLGLSVKCPSQSNTLANFEAKIVTTFHCGTDSRIFQGCSRPKIPVVTELLRD
jgi:flavin reductase (DIM6/NTAB) family NADH-FMN oxidoreductase RutF